MTFTRFCLGGWTTGSPPVKVTFVAPAIDMTLAIPRAEPKLAALLPEVESTVLFERKKLTLALPALERTALPIATAIPVTVVAPGAERAVEAVLRPAIPMEVEPCAPSTPIPKTVPATDP